MIEAIIYCGIFVYILFLLYQKWARPSDFPPGPPILPIIGSLPFMGLSPLKTFKEWRAKHGNIIGLKMGSFNVVILHDHAIIKEAYSEAAFSGRILLKPLELLVTKNKRGLVLSEGKTWQEQRRFALKNLRDFGFGKKSMEAMSQEDVADLIVTFKDQAGQPISPDRKFSLAILNSLWHIIAGERFSLGDPKFQEVLDKLSGAISGMSASSAAFLIPSLAEYAPEFTGLARFSNAVSSVKALLQSYIDNHKETFQSDNLRDFMDVYLQEIHSTTDPDSSFYKNVGDENMLVGSINLFGAGAETTSGTLNWALYYLSKNLESQKKLQDEIDNEIGHFRLPNLDDRGKLPYADAVMLEVFRMSSLLPLSLPHKTMEDVTFHGYNIPKGTMILANLFAIHYDETIWSDPEQFRPERFLTSDEKEIDKTHPPVFPFSIGKRACIGETLARNNFFLFLTSLFQRFCIVRDKGSKEGSSTRGGVIRTAPEFKVIFQDRLELLDP